MLTNFQKNTLKCQVGNRSVDALLDSGASISCISKDFLSKSSAEIIKSVDSDVGQVSGVGGHTMKVDKKVRIGVKFSNVFMECDFYVIDKIQQDVILGLDFMTKHKVKINFGNKTVSIEDDSIVVGLTHISSGTARLTRFVTIPPIPCVVHRYAFPVDLQIKLFCWNPFQC